MKTTEEIIKICEKYNIQNYTINTDMSIDINGSLYICDKYLSELPLDIRYVKGKVTLDENFIDNWNIFDKLERIDGDLKIQFNLFKTLYDIPIDKVGGDIDFTKWYPHQTTTNPIHYLWILFNDISKVKLFNSMGILKYEENPVFRHNPPLLEWVVYYDKLIEFLDEIKKPKPTPNQLRNIRKYYTVIKPRKKTIRLI